MRRIYLSGPGSSSAASWCVSPAAPAESWSQNCSDQGRRPNRTPRWSCPSCPHSSCFPRCRSRKAPPASSPRWSSWGVWAHLPGIQRRCRPPWGPSGRQLHLRCSSAVPEVMMCHGEVTQPDSPTAGSRRNLPAERKRSWQKRRSRPQNTRHDRICQLPKVPSRLSPPPCPFLNHWQTPQTISAAAVAVLRAGFHFFQKGSRSCKVFLEEDRVPGALHYSAHKGKHRPTALTFLPHWPGLGYPVPPPPRSNNGPAHSAQLLIGCQNFQVARQVQRSTGVCRGTNEKAAQSPSTNQRPDLKQGYISNLYYVLT